MLSSSQGLIAHITKYAWIRTLLLLGCCSFFAVPIINAQGQANGHWISLCTTKGIQLLLVQDSTNTSEQHEESECPCIQNCLHSTHAITLTNLYTSFTLARLDSFTIQTVKTFEPQLARGPPVLLSQ